MKVRLIDVDSKIPNLALMKISSWHKAQGDIVTMDHIKADKYYASIVFTKNHNIGKQLLKQYPGIRIGGTGWNLENKLPCEIESTKPDYDLYTTDDIYKRICRGIGKKETKIKKAKTIVDAGIGFTSRGCIRNCGFCVVPKKEGKLVHDTPLSEIINPRSNVVVLLDNNLTADPNVLDKLKEIKERDLIVDITQGIDVRLVTPEIAKALSEIKHLRSIHYAWDLMNFEEQVISGIKMLSSYIKIYRHMCFMLVGYNTSFEEDMYRFIKLDEIGIRPYVMVYNDKKDFRLRHFARWVNGRFHKACKWEEYSPWVRHQLVGEQLSW